MGAIVASDDDRAPIGKASSARRKCRNDAGENHTTSSDTLTSNSSLAKKNQGDGGDDRGARSAALAKAN